MVQTVIGIDPGATGAIAIRHDGRSVVHKMPKAIEDVSDLLQYYHGLNKNMVVILEQIRLHRTEDPAIAAQMQKLYGHYRELRSILKINSIQYAEASPKAWQSFLGLNSKAITKLEKPGRKRAYRDFAQAWWPEKLPIIVADAVCLVIYGERNLKYNPEFGTDFPEQLKTKL